MLAAGRARVELDPTFAETIDTARYEAFATPRGDCKGLYVTASDATGFEVRELQGGTSAVEFSWRVLAKRKDAPTGHRLATVTAPTVLQTAAPQAPSPGPTPAATPTTAPAATPTTPLP